MSNAPAPRALAKTKAPAKSAGEVKVMSEPDALSAVLKNPAPTSRPQLDRNTASRLDCSNRKSAPKMPILCTPTQKEACVMFYDAIRLVELI
jgi:hypothetical protein